MPLGLVLACGTPDEKLMPVATNRNENSGTKVQVRFSFKSE
jgi:hypothetical protein